MREIRKTFAFLGNAAVVAIVVLSIIAFIYFRYFGIYAPLPGFIKLKQSALFFFAMAYVLLIPCLVISSLPISWRAGLIMITVPICCSLGYITLSFPEQIFQSGQLNEHNYYVSVAAVPLDTMTAYTLYRCDKNDLNCEKIYKELGGVSIHETDLLVDNTRQEVHFFHNTFLSFTDGANPHTYELLSAARLGKDVYWLASFDSQNAKEFIFYRCNDEIQADCEILPFQYSQVSFRDSELIVDESKRLVSIQIDNALIYIYGDQPQCFVKGCLPILK